MDRSGPTPLRGGLFRGAIFSVALFAVVRPGPAQAQGTVNWTFRGPIAPIARAENAMVYDQGNQRMVLFAGYDLNFNRSNDIWEYNGSGRTWTNVTPSGGSQPSRRQGAALAYDPLRQRILMFGGSDNQGTVVLGDTWQWNTVTKTWTQLNPSPAPPARVGSRMVCDAANDRIVLQGGWNSFTGAMYADTWAWNPGTATWTNLNPSVSSGSGRPFSQRTYHGLVYNTTNNRVTIFGGRGPTDLNDLWELQGNTWVDITPGGTLPPGRGWSGVTYESSNNRLVLYGGWNNTGMFSYQDSWAWNGSSWTQLANGPTPRDSHQFVWDPNRGKSVVFGGFSNDVWELTGGTWTGPFNEVRWPPAQDEHSIAYDPINASGHRRIFLYGGGAAHVWETFHFGSNNGTLTWRYPWLPAGGPGGRIGHDMVYETSRDRAILFGGRQRTNGVVGATVYGDTWAFTRTPALANPAWTSLGGGPPARYDHAMVYDPGHDQIVLFGGRDAAGTPLADTWIWNGSSWLPAGGGPPARFGHSMTYDSARGVVVLFGGDNGAGGKLGDTWEWNGSLWAQRATTGPSARSGAALAFLGGACGGVLMFGGRDQSSVLLDDEWIWNGTSWSSIAAPLRPSPRVNARMVWDPAEGRIWLFGGLTAAGLSGEMWTATTVPATSGFSVNDVIVTETNSATTATFTVSLSPPQPAPASVSYATANGTATAGSDYTATSGTLAFAACQSAAVVSVPVTGDLVYEPDETFFLNLSSPSGAPIADGQGQATILNDDPPPTLSINDVSVAEGNTGTTNAVFTVTLAGPTALAATVNFQTANGTATSGSDYGIVLGTLTFPVGTTTQTISVPVMGDRIFEGNETFFVNLSGATNATIADPQGVGTILDDDPQGLSINDVTAVEGTTAVFTVTLSPVNPTQTVTVNYTTANGTAVAPGDYPTTSGTLTFPPGTATRPISVPIATDTLVEGAETFFVNLSGATNATIAYAQGQGTILDPGGGGDFNADGKPDILWRNQASGDNLVWLMNGTTIASGAVLTAITDTNWRIVGTADFNADGKTDILWRNQATGDNLVWFMNGTTIASGAVLTSVPDPSWQIVATGDFNADGKPDILWRNQATGDNLVWFMNGTSVAGGAVLTPIADVNWRIAGAGDFNADGKPDILWRNQATGDNLVWFMNGTTVAGGAVLTAISDLNWVVGGIGDFNADGKTDIVWRNQAGGDDVVWFMNGTTIAGGAVLTSITDTNWRMAGPR